MIMFNRRLVKSCATYVCIICMIFLLVLSACSQDTELSADPSDHIKEPPDSTEDGYSSDFSLFEAYEDYFVIGTIYTHDNLEGMDKDLLLTQFNAITPENIMKPEYMQPTQGSFHYDDSDKMMDFAVENDLFVAGHVLAWHQQTGGWLGQNISKEQAIEQLRSHITNIVSKYKGKISSWDVVNEAIADDMALPEDNDWTKCLRQTQWLRSIGPEYIAMAFQFAREADSDVRLYYNDYNLNVKSKADVVYAMVKDLLEQGVPIDGIGMQGHYSTDTTDGPVRYSVDLFSTLDIEISITELDVTVNNADHSGLTEEQELQQAIVYAKLFSLFKEYKDVIARVTFWGNLDSKSWRSDRFPCLFNADYSPKLAVSAILDPEAFLEENAVDFINEANVAQANYGTPVIDGDIDDVWADCSIAPVNIPIMAWEGATGAVRLLWDEAYVYVLFEVEDELLNMDSANVHEQDSIEIFLDQYNEKLSHYGDGAGQYRVNYNGDVSFGTIPSEEGFSAAAKTTDTGYIIEMAILLLDTPAEGDVMGFDAQINDSDDKGVRQSMTKFNDPTNNSYLSPEQWGEMILVK